MRQKNILDEVYDYVGRFVAFPDDNARVAHTLWVAHTHLMDAFYTTPRLHILSAEKRCGKTTLLTITELLVNNPISIVNPSPASLFTLIEQEHPTLLLDEIDRTFNKKDTSELTSIINSGFRHGAKVRRVSLEPRKVDYFDVFGPMVLAGIDNSRIPDTIVDRSIPIRLKRRLDEKIESYRPKKNEAEGIALRAKIASWAVSVLDKAKGMTDPIFPEGIEQRNADKWEALFIVADVSDVTDVSANSDGWGKRVRLVR
jgi:hypothetical protein